MVKPKRHHWWPMAQSRFWTDTAGLVTVTRADGSTFRANPVNIGVESELYTRFGEDDTKDTSVEDWFAETIDAPAGKMIEHLLDPANVVRTPFRGNPEKAKTAKILGLRINPYIDHIRLPPTIRQAIAQYVAALLVRHPRYLARLVDFEHQSTPAAQTAKNRALDNMLRLFRAYVDRIGEAVFLLTRRSGSSEYLYADGGLVVEEPWRREYGVPFDIHAPLTPDIALQVFPIPLRDAQELTSIAVAEVTNQGVSRHNRIILGGATRFVFSRQAVQSAFVTRYIGKPAPKTSGTELSMANWTPTTTPIAARLSHTRT